MELIDRILSDENIKAAIHAVKSNRGAAGIDKMTVEALEVYFAEHGEGIKDAISANTAMDSGQIATATRP